MILEITDDYPEIMMQNTSIILVPCLIFIASLVVTEIRAIRKIAGKTQ
jgi:hypothetical protein